MSDATRAAEREAWIALASTPGVGDVTFSRLIAGLGGAAATLAAVKAEPEHRADAWLRRRTGLRIRDGLAAAIRRSADDPTRALRRLADLGGWALTPFDAGYPSALVMLEEPPSVLYGLGDPASIGHRRCVAVVGTRRPTPRGRDLAHRIGARLAEAGACVISGLAYGIDGAVHLATLEAGGSTVAVVGSGVDAPGPVAHRRLAERIRATGAIVSELAPGVRATTGTFPRRNRIISGLASSTIVVEAPARSGALITARHALEQGRTLLVAPGRPLDRSVAGNLALLRDSPARPLVGLDEMIVDLGLDGQPDPGDSRQAATMSAAQALALLGQTERAVARAIREGPQSIDALTRSTGLAPGVVAGAITMLQLRGWARVHGAIHLAAGPLLGPAEG